MVMWISFFSVSQNVAYAFPEEEDVGIALQNEGLNKKQIALIEGAGYGLFVNKRCGDSVFKFERVMAFITTGTDHYRIPYAIMIDYMAKYSLVYQRYFEDGMGLVEVCDQIRAQLSDGQ